MINFIAVISGFIITVIFYVCLAYDAITNPINGDIQKFPDAPKRGDLK